MRCHIPDILHNLRTFFGSPDASLVAVAMVTKIKCVFWKPGPDFLLVASSTFSVSRIMFWLMGLRPLGDTNWLSGELSDWWTSSRKKITMTIIKAQKMTKIYLGTSPPRGALLIGLALWNLGDIVGSPTYSRLPYGISIGPIVLDSRGGRFWPILCTGYSSLIVQLYCAAVDYIRPIIIFKVVIKTKILKV